MEIMICSAFVCLSVCLSVRLLATSECFATSHQNYPSDFHEHFTTDMCIIIIIYLYQAHDS